MKNVKTTAFVNSLNAIEGCVKPMRTHAIIVFSPLVQNFK